MILLKSQQQCLITRILLLLVAFLSLLLQEGDHHVRAQEFPSNSYSTEQFNPNVMFRQSFCDRQDMYHNGTIRLEDALQGLEIRTVIVKSEFVRFDENNNSGTIRLDPVYPGLIAVLLDEIAERAQFTWRDSYAVSNGLHITDNHTWTDLLQWTTTTYDLSVDWWVTSVDRLRLGIDYPKGWYDGSVIMVGSTTTTTDYESHFHMWAFLTPFTLEVWGLILATLIASGVIYWLLENIDKHSDRQRLETDVYENIFLAGLTFTSHFEFSPRTNAARLFTFSLSFWALIVGAAYTANLASFFVIINTPSASINTIQDAIRLHYPMCVVKTTQAETTVLEMYPLAKPLLIGKESNEEVFLGLHDGECKIAITTISAWDTWSRDISVNSGCNLDVIGRVISFADAGFATKADSGTLCTSILSDVINIHMMQLEKDGVISDAWNEHLQKISTINCNVLSEGDVDNDLEENSRKIGLRGLGGIFVFHYILSFSAILIAFIYKYKGWDQIPRFSKFGPMSRKAIRQAKIDQSSGQDEKMRRRSTIIKNAAERKTFIELVRDPSRRSTLVMHGVDNNNNNDKSLAEEASMTTIEVDDKLIESSLYDEAYERMLLSENSDRFTTTGTCGVMRRRKKEGSYQLNDYQINELVDMKNQMTQMMSKMSTALQVIENSSNVENDTAVTDGPNKTTLQPIERNTRDNSIVVVKGHPFKFEANEVP